MKAGEKCSCVLLRSPQVEPSPKVIPTKPGSGARPVELWDQLNSATDCMIFRGASLRTKGFRGRGKRWVVANWRSKLSRRARYCGHGSHRVLALSRL